jgi:hypothetical protein
MRDGKTASAIGFSPGTPNEVDQLREVYRCLNDITRNLASARKSLQQEDLRMAEHHLQAAEWHAGRAKERIAAVGQVKALGGKAEGIRSASTGNLVTS